MKRTKWLIYTVTIGLIPFLIRFFVFLFYKERTVDFLFNEMDFVIFGLILNLANINELEDKNNIDEVWKTQGIGISVIFIIIFSAILGLNYLNEILQNTKLDRTVMKICTFILSLVSFFISYSIFNRINTITYGKH